MLPQATTTFAYFPHMPDHSSYYHPFSVERRFRMSAMLEAVPAELAAASRTPYHVSVQEYVTFHEQGFLVVRGLVARDEVRELTDHMDNLLAGRESIPGVEAPSFTAPGERLQYWLRIHMLHRRLALHERFLLHP